MPDAGYPSYFKALASQESVWQRCLAHLLLPPQCKGVYRARLRPRSRGLLVTACLSCGAASRQSQDKNEEESHGNRNAGDR
jgi:RNase P subunit RPR2